MNRLELIIDERDDKQQAFRYYSALHELSISQGKNEIILLLHDNKQRFQEMAAECESEIHLRWLQGAIQLIDSFTNLIEESRDKLNAIRTRM